MFAQALTVRVSTPRRRKILFLFCRVTHDNYTTRNRGWAMTQGRAYDQTLRAIGQALEAQELNTFELRRNGENYFIRGEPGRKVNALKVWMRKWQGQDPMESSDLTYTSQDIESLDRAGQTKRNRLQRLPDFHSLSNILRTVGAYLDMKGAHLLQVHKKELTLMILYQTRQGHPEIEERTIASFYDLSLQMYRRRQKKPSA